MARVCVCVGGLISFKSRTASVDRPITAVGLSPEISLLKESGADLSTSSEKGIGLLEKAPYI